MRQITIILSMVLLLSSLAIANYESYGQDQYWNNNTALFERNFECSTCTQVRSVTSPNGMPLVADMNLDGEKDIVIITANGIEIFNKGDFGLTTVSSLAVAGWVTSHQAELFDIDADGHKELILIDNKYFWVFSYDNDTIIQDQKATLWGGFSGEGMLKCAGDDCVVIGGTSGTGGTGVKIIYARVYKSSGVTHAYTIQTVSDTNYKAICLPDTKHIDFTDWDGDDEKEFVFNYGVFYQSGVTDYMVVVALQINASGFANKTSSFGYDVHGDKWSASTTGSCTGNEMGKKFTSASVYDYAPASGEEVVIAEQTDGNSFRIYMYQNDGGFIDEFPEITLDPGNGELISNVIRADVFGHPEDIIEARDFCVMGYHEADEELNLICGSKSSEDFGESRDFKMTENANLSINSARFAFSRVVHSLQTDGTDFENPYVIDGDYNPSEFTSPYGVIGITDYPIDPLFDGDIDIFYNPIVSEKTVIPVSHDSIVPDLIAITGNAVYYFDDDFSNLPPYMDYFKTDPCIEDPDTGSSTIIDKTSDLEITVGLEDRESELLGDLVSARVTLYHGKAYNITAPLFDAQDGWSDNLSEDDNFVFLFTDIDPSLPDGLASDDFETGTTTGGSGWDSSWVSTGTVTTLGTPRGTYHLSVDAGETAERNTTFEGIEDMTAVNVSFWFKAVSMGAGDVCNVSVYTGSEWVEVISASPGVLDDDTYRQYNYDMTQHTLTNPISIKFHKNQGQSDCYIDDISIVGETVIDTFVGETIRIEYRDTTDPDDVQFEERTFNVGDDGIFKGDCITEEILADPSIPIDEDEPSGSPLDVEDNAVTKGLEEMDDLGFRGLGGAIKWFFIMAVVIVAIFFTGAQAGYTGFQSTTIAVIVGFIMTYIGIKLQFISTAIVIIGLVIAIGFTIGLFRLIFLSSNT